MFGSEQWAYASGGGYDIEQSVRFNDNDSAYLSWTPASAGNRKTWTWSGWVKRGNLGGVQRIFSADDGSASTDQDYNSFFFTSSDQLQFGGNLTNFRITSAVYRDVGSWYHIVLVTDTTDATATDRFKLYVNGEQVTSFGTENNPSQNTDLAVNAAIGHYIASIPSGNYLDAYLSEVNFIDGQALTPDDFGEFDVDTPTFWKPKRYAGTYGTNGFYLDFADGGALGNDVSGNNNDWTATNLASTDVMLDSPTNNFATLNPLSRINWVGQDYATLAEGNLQNNGSNNGNHIDSTMAFSSGKWYWETMVGQYGFAGVRATHAVYNADGTYRYYNNDGNITYGDPASSSYGSTIGDYASGTAGDVIGVAIDCDSNEIKFYRNNSLLHTQSSIGAWEYSPITGCAATSNQVINFGQDSSFAGNKTPQGYTDANGRGDFYYAPPTGYLALCTANLPTPSILDAGQHFNTVLYTGDGSATSITGVGFQPDFLWIKRRGTLAASHVLADAVRGAGKELSSNGTGAETDNITRIASFDSDGWSFGSGSNVASLNSSTSSTYVAWNWKANGSGVTNTDGSITSTVSANVDAGFSIVGYTGNGTAGATIGHGLGSTPELYITKGRGNADHWVVGLGHASNYLYLNLTNAQASHTGFWNNTAPTSSVISLGSDGINNGSGLGYITYCFHSVESYSKCGVYTGNGSSDGPMVYCGFRPAYVMVKRTNSTGIWAIQDAARGPYNEIENYLEAQTSDAEATTASGYDMDYLSNGFKVRNLSGSWNASGGTYIFIAFAENPFKYSNAR